MTALALLSLVPATSRAEGFAVRATPEGLAWIAEAARQKAPKQLTIPTYSKELFDCPLTEDDISATASEGAVQLNLQSVTITPLNQKLRVETVLDLDATALLHLQYPYACFGEADCGVRIRASSLPITLEVGMAEDGNGNIVATSATVGVALDPNGFELDSEGCLVGDALEWGFELVEGWALDMLRPKLEEYASNMVYEKLRETIQGLADQEIEMNGFTLEAWLEGMDIDPVRGLTVSADATVAWNGGGTPSMPDIPATEGPALPLGMAGQLQLAAADVRITQGIQEAWRAGLLTQYLGDLAPTIELPEDGIVQKLGMPAGSSVGASFEIGAAPKILFGRDQGAIRIEMTDAILELQVASPGSPLGTMEIHLDGKISAIAKVNPILGALQLEPTGLEVTRLEMITNSDHLHADPAKINAFLQDVVMPMMGDKLAAMPLAPAVKPLAGLYLIGREVQAAGGWLRVGIDGYLPDPSDSQAPDTRFINPPGLVGPATTAFEVAGSDDTTPGELLQFQAILDGQPVGEPSFVHAVRVAAADGEHTLEVAAVDVHGRVDATPAVHQFTVDGIAPTLEILEKPPAVVDGSTKARWRASDNRTAVETRWELRQVSGRDLAGKIIAQQDFAAGLEVASIDDLDSNQLYILRVIARDEAGNLTSSDMGFSTPDGGGCAASGGGGTLWSMLLVMGAVLAARRARRRLAVTAGLAVMGASSLASAQAVGSAFSGPTEADGASAFWNPAAMSLGGSVLDVGSNATVVRAGYQPMESASSDLLAIKPEPTIGATFDQLHERVRLGFTFSVPSGNGAVWDRADGAGQTTRYYAVDAKQFFMAFTPAASVRITKWLSVGAGVDVVRSYLSYKGDKDMGSALNQAAHSTTPDSPFPYADPSMAAPVDMKLGGWGFGAVGGIMLQPHPSVRIGVSARLHVETDAHGELSVQYPERMRSLVEDLAPGAQLPALSGKTSAALGLPMMASAGIAYRPSSLWELGADYRFTKKSAEKSMDIIMSEATTPDVKDQTLVYGKRDRHGVTLRLARAFLGGRAQGVIRGGYEGNAIPEATYTPSHMDFEKYELGVAARWMVSKKMMLIGQYSHHFLLTQHIDESLHQPLSEPALSSFNHPSSNGKYYGAADTLGLTLSVKM